MKQIYKNMYKNLVSESFVIKGQEVHFSELSHFVGRKGKNFNSNLEVRLLVAGRAVNGWESFSCIDEDAFSEEAEIMYNTPLVLDSDERGPYFEGNNGNYYLSHSSFWRVTKKVLEQLTNESYLRFTDYLAWTNLYKIAPKDSGNPTASLCKKQSSFCFDILKKEINDFAPTHILLITGWNGWIENSKPEYDFSHLFTEKGKDNPVEYVECTTTFRLDNGREIPVVVICRPERKNEKDISDNVIKAFCDIHNFE